MTIMIDIEGDFVPKEYDENLFNLSLFGNGELTINIPMQFKTDDGEYNGDGVLFCNLREILKEYLENAIGLDGGEGLLPLSELLNEFSTAYSKLAKELIKKK